MNHLNVTTNAKTANLIAGALCWRIDGANASAKICADDALKCSLRGDFEGCARRSLDGLAHQVGIGHKAYQRALCLAKNRV